MPRFRNLLGRVAMVWLLCQAMPIVLVPAVLWPANGAQLLECTCAHGDHTICPMHHPPASASNRCAMRGLADVEDAAVASLLGPVGLMQDRGTLVLQPSAIIALQIVANAAALRAAPPDPPPL
jgi:hypothetical protein